ncbi:hypothetical protein LNV47_00555 [Paucibacter sp. DJ4R-1]|nr:hypothetical protein [Paucibacter sp. DJ4R-1]
MVTLTKRFSTSIEDSLIGSYMLGEHLRILWIATVVDTDLQAIDFTEFR